MSKSAARAVPDLSKRKYQIHVMEYVRTCANCLGLTEWTFHFDWETSAEEASGNEGAAASIDCIYGRKHAVVRFGSDFDEYSEDKIKHYIVHELVHPHLAHLQAITTYDIQDHFDYQSWKLYYGIHLRTLEYTVDGLTDVMIDLCPGFKWPK